MKRGEWNELPDQQRQDLQNTFRHTGQMARYTNFMGIKTVRSSPRIDLLSVRFSTLADRSRYDHT